MINPSGELKQILIDLIACESVTDNEKNICDLIEKALEEFEGELVRTGNSLVLHLPGDREKRVALVGHIDTVPLGESTTTAFEKDGALFGRGACDMKAGVAVMLRILGDLRAGKLNPKLNLSFVFYEGEEGPVPNGINALLGEGHLKDVDFAFILEPTESRYSVGCLGSLAVKKTVRGVSAHSANPKTGVNALEEAMELYRKLGAMDRQIGANRLIDGLSYYETVNVTALNTFNAYNVLPPRAELIINYRFSPERSTEEALALLYSHMGRENTEILDASGSAYAGNSADRFLLPGTEKEIMQAWTDMAQLIEAGIPAINYGPGSIRHAHKPDEHILLSELESFYKNMIRHL